MEEGRRLADTRFDYETWNVGWTLLVRGSFSPGAGFGLSGVGQSDCFSKSYSSGRGAFELMEQPSHSLDGEIIVAHNRLRWG